MILSTLAMVGASMMGATFDATDQSPEYMTGIQQVYAVADNGTEVVVPVYSLPYCEEEDGTGDPCVWVAGEQGNLDGQSFIQLGDEDNRIFADVTVWAAEILVDPNAVVPDSFNAESVAPVAPVVEAETVEVEQSAEAVQSVEDIGHVENVQTPRDIVMPVCEHEDGSGQGNVDCVFFSERNGHAVVNYFSADGEKLFSDVISWGYGIDLTS